MYLLKALVNNRYFIISSVIGELKGRFARSKLGLAWTILNPICQAAIYAVILSEVLGAKFGAVDNKAAYAIYLLSGIACWSLFSEIVNRSLTVFIEYAQTIKKYSFPKICLPAIVFLGAIINHIFLLLSVLVIAMFFGHFPSEDIIFIPIGILITSMFAFGIGVFLGVLNVFARDVGQVVSVLLQVWFWFTPIVYATSSLSEGIRSSIALNPMTNIINFYQTIILFKRAPDLTALLYPVVCAVVMCFLAIFIFRRASADIVDAI